MDGRDIIIILLTGLVLWFRSELNTMTEKWRVAERGWTTALLHIRNHNIPLPTYEECKGYLEEMQHWGKSEKKEG